MNDSNASNSNPTAPDTISIMTNSSPTNDLQDNDTSKSSTRFQTLDAAPLDAAPSANAPLANAPFAESSPRESATSAKADETTVDFSHNSDEALHARIEGAESLDDTETPEPETSRAAAQIAMIENDTTNATTKSATTGNLDAEGGDKSDTNRDDLKSESANLNDAAQENSLATRNDSSAASDGAASDGATNSSEIIGGARRSFWAVRVPAVLTALMGAINLWSTVTPGLPDRAHILNDWLPLEVKRGSHLAAALAGFALVLLAHSLWRRKQVGWGLTLAALLFSAIAHIVKGLDYEEAIFALGLAGWLWLARRHYHARSDAPSMRQGLLVLASAFVFTLAYGTLGFFLLDTHFSVHYGWRAAAWKTVAMFTQFADPGLEPLTHFGHYFANSIYFVAFFTFAYAAIMLLRPVVMPRGASPEDRRKAREIVHAHGRTAFAFCALFDDKTYWFSPGGSVVAYAVVGRIAVSMGDPIGPREDAENAIRGWIAFCERNDWRPAFYEVYDEYSNFYREAGLLSLRVGHEAIVDVQNFSLSGKDRKNMRNIVNSLTKNGYRAQVYQPPLAEALMRELREVSDEWLTMMNGSEKEFSLGSFQDDYIRNGAVIVIHDTNNNERIDAFANIVPEFQLNESTIDLMRRRPDCAKSTMEFLFVSLFDWAKEQGFATFNVGPSPFAMIGEHSEDPATEKAIHFIYEHINQFYNFKGLHAFKEKFDPTWRPLFLVYSGAAGLPIVAAAIIRADSGQNSWRHFLKHLRGGA